jgi:small subunit ribosomal protein S17
MAECKDENCPSHGSLKVGRRLVTGTVSSSRMRRTVSVKREHRVFMKKYERYARRFSTVKAHNPDCIGAVEGDTVRIAQCRPLSKTKHFVVMEKVKNAGN